ncbi:acetyltransferase [Vibrio metschnikovii]|uniref:acetyltransferase n=1 Tax=Vibrio metschnikovii TaxID=28172 RepID=UPI001C3059BD|nr:acetyltransferase [Vibrio metschnikovii]
MKKLYLVGAGGFAREIYSYINEESFVVNEHKLYGFLSDFKADLDAFNVEHTVVGEMFNSRLDKSDAIIIAVADCVLKEKIFQYYSKLGVNILSYVHPTAFVGKNVEIGQGSVICPYATLTCDISLGRGTTINAHSSIGHDAKIGDFSTLSGHCDVTGFVQLGEKVFMGSHALVIPNVKIGDMAVIGAGSVVISKVKPGVTMFGNPAKKIK